MATNLYFRDYKNTGFATQFRMMISTAGHAQKNPVVNTAAAGTNIQWTATAGGELLEWISGRSPAGGWTLAGSVSVTLYAFQSDLAANVGARLRLYKRTAAGVETEIGGSPWDDGVEFTTSIASYTWSFTPTSTAFAEDDRLIARMFITNVGGTMAAGHTATMRHDQTSFQVADSRITITENVTFKIELIEWDHINTTGKNSNVQMLTGNLTALSDNSPTSTHFAGKGKADTLIGSGDKKYWEITVTNSGAIASNDAGVGVCNSSQAFTDNTFIGSTTNGIAWYCGGDVYYNSSPVTSIGNWAAPARIDVACHGGTAIWFRVNGGNWNNSGTANPATGVGGITSISGMGDIFPAYNVRNNGSLMANFGGSTFEGTPPAGFTSFFDVGSTEEGAGDADGAGAAAGVGTAIAEAAGAASGSGAAAGAGTAEHVAQGAAAAAGAAAGVGAALATADGAATATGSAAALGDVLAIGVGAAAATSAASATGEADSIGSATGLGTAAGAGELLIEGAGAAAATSSAAAIGEMLVPGAGDADGISIATGHGIEATTAEGTGAASSTSSAAAQGIQAAIGMGYAQGFSDVGGVGEQFAFPEPIAYPLVPPPEFCPRELRIASRNTTMAQSSPTTGQQLLGPTSFERWEWEIQFPPLPPEQGEPVAAFLESLRGMRGAFLFGNPKKRRARGSARQGDNPIVEGSTERTIHVNATSILGNRKRWLAAGDMISIGLGVTITRRLYRVLRDVDLAFGKGVIDIWPALRIVPLIPGDTIVVENPTGVFRLRNNEVEFEIDRDGFYHFPRIPIVQWIFAMGETPDGVAITTGQAQGESNVAGVGSMIVTGTGIALGTSFAVAGGGENVGTAIAIGVSSAAAIGGTIVVGTGVAAAVSNAQAQGNTGTFVTGTGAATSTSSAFGFPEGEGGGGNIEAEGELLTLSIDGVSYGPAP